MVCPLSHNGKFIWLSLSNLLTSMSVSIGFSSGSTDSYIFSFEATSGTDGNDSSAICARLDSFS